MQIFNFQSPHPVWYVVIVPLHKGLIRMAVGIIPNRKDIPENPVGELLARIREPIHYIGMKELKEKPCGLHVKKRTARRVCQMRQGDCSALPQ